MPSNLNGGIMSLRKILGTTSALLATFSTASAQNSTNTTSTTYLSQETAERVLVFGVLPAVAVGIIACALYELKKDKRKAENHAHMEKDLESIKIEVSERTNKNKEQDKIEQPSHPTAALATGYVDSASDGPIEVEEVEAPEQRAPSPRKP